MSGVDLLALAGRALCAIGQHPCRTNSDDTGVWGECVRCHRRFGFVDRATLRRFADTEAARAQHPSPDTGADAPPLSA